MCFRQVPAFNTRATANVFNKEGTERYPGPAWLSEEGLARATPKADTPKISSSRARRRPRKSRTPSWQEQQGQKQPHTSQMMWGRDGQGKNPTTLLELTVSQCDCAHVWTAGIVKPYKPRSRGDPAPSPPKPGRRGRINHAQLWSERLEKGCGVRR